MACFHQCKLVFWVKMFLLVVEKLLLGKIILKGSFISLNWLWCLTPWSLTICLYAAVRTINWTSVSSLWRLEIYLCHWLWGTSGGFSFWISRWWKISQLHFWLSSYWYSCWQVACQGGCGSVLHLLAEFYSFLQVHLRGWDCKFQVVLPEGSKDPKAVVSFPVEQHLEVIFLIIRDWFLFVVKIFSEWPIVPCF